uniref:NR LBD domain-containing protein n=3 Tax=Caenorhabditis tropicalis TaxID=1561998 RepID=A0A1I7TAT6_9PELO
MEELKMRDSKKPVELMKYIGKNEYIMFWEKTFLSAAHWFSEIPEFAELDLDVKIEILKSTWMVRARLEKLAETADLQRKREMSSGVYMLTDDSCVELEKVEVDLSWCTNYSTEQMQFYCLPDSDTYWKESVEALINLKPTNVELNFMLIHLCLCDAGKRNRGKVQEAADSLLQIQCDNLHDYYSKSRNTSHYSGRLAQMMKVNKLIEKGIRMRREKNCIAKLFDVFSVDFSHPEMFDLT